MKVYIAGPLSGTPTKKAENVERAKLAALELLLQNINFYCPHLLCAIDEMSYISYETWMKIDMEWLECCDAMLFLGSSPGADRERKRAEELGLPVLRKR